MECNENLNINPDFLFKKIYEDNQNWDDTCLLYTSDAADE